MSKAHEKTVEEKMQTLREMVSWFEGDDFTIDQAMKRFEDAKKLAEEIEHELKELQNTVQVVKEKFDA